MDPEYVEDAVYMEELEASEDELDIFEEVVEAEEALEVTVAEVVLETIDDVLDMEEETEEELLD